MQVVLLCQPPGACCRVSRSSRDTRAWVRFGASHFPGYDLCLRRGPCCGAALLSGREVIKSEWESLLFASVRGGSFVHVGQACCRDTLRKVFRTRKGGS